MMAKIVNRKALLLVKYLLQGQQEIFDCQC